MSKEAESESRFRMVPVYTAVQKKPLVLGIGLDVLLFSGTLFYFSWMVLGWTKPQLAIGVLLCAGLYLIKRLREYDEFAIEAFLIGLGEPAFYEKGVDVGAPPKNVTPSRLPKEF